MTDPRQLLASISWDGASLSGFENLSKDLAFRAALTASLALPAQSAGRVAELVIEQQRGRFYDLLLEAIGKLGWRIESLMDSAPPSAFVTAVIKSTGCVPIGLSPEQMWAARPLIFKTLTENPEFIQLVRELKVVEGWRRKIPGILPELKQLAQELAGNKKPPEDFETGALARVGYSLSPLLTSALYVVPVVLGAQIVTTHVIEKQSEARKIESAYIAKYNNRDRLEKIVLITCAEGDSATKRGTPTDVAEDLQVVTARCTGDGSAAKDPNFKFYIHVPKLEVGVPKLEADFKTPITIQNNLPSPPDHFTFLLGNAPTFHQGNAPDSPPAGELEVRNQDSDPQLRQPAKFGLLGPSRNPAPKPAGNEGSEQPNGIEPLSIQLKSGDPKPPDPPKSLFFEFQRGQNPQQPVPTKKNIYLALCNDAPPYEFAKGKNSSLKCEAPKGQTKPDPLFITNTSEYDGDLDAYVNIDSVSERKYFLFGPRRVVVRVTPAK